MKFNIPELTVTEFSNAIKSVVEDAFGYLRIKGEITGLKESSNGHLYFSLKDQNSILSAVCFRNSASNIKTTIGCEIANGLQVCASGRITTFEGRSNYQMIVESIEIAGIGAILEMIEKRKKKLFEEGLFDSIHKKPIPFFPKTIGIITSETGAVIEDIKHRINDRCPTHILLYHSLVQGEKAAKQLVLGLKFFNKLKDRPDVLIIARGGGSFEDLLPFSDEELVREVFKSEIPVISAIGHETDTSLIDLVADLRAPTPTAAAEMATPILKEIKSRLNFLDERLNFLPQKILEQNFSNLKNLSRHIADPSRITTQIDNRLLLLIEKMNFSWENFYEKKLQHLNNANISNQNFLQRIISEKQKIGHAFELFRSKLENELQQKNSKITNLAKSLKSNHYYEVLKRGFALITNQNNELISSVKKINQDKKIIIEMFDGKIGATAENAEVKIFDSSKC